ncbi:MAG: helix-turn-helix domain-containing protein [Paracoccaceae bacterium]
MLGERLRVARARARLTMADVARECDCTAQAVMKWEADKSMPSSGKFLTLCRILDVSAEWLMAGEPLDFQSTDTAPQGRHAKYWVRAALEELSQEGLTFTIGRKTGGGR